MADENTGPLTGDHLIQITQQLDRIKHIEFEIERAKRAGINVSDAESRLAKSKAQLQQIKNVYFPGR